jgi:D-aspartate ligase
MPLTIKDKFKPPLSPAVILSFEGYAEAYDIVRSLGMAGIPSIVASCGRHNIAYYSRYCSGHIVLPHRKDGDGDVVLEMLIRLADSLGGKSVLYYVSDPELTFVWKHRDELQKHFHFTLPDNDTLSHLFNKVLFHQLAGRYHLPVPYAVSVKNVEEIAALGPELRFPCIMKPGYSHDWEWETPAQRKKYGTYKQALRRFTSKEELLDFCVGLPKRESGFVIQSYLDGPDDTILSFHGYFDENSRCLGCFMGEKIRTYPPRTGGSVYVRTILNPELTQSSMDFLCRMKFRGIVKIDFKWDDVEQSYKILEINPRYNLWVLLGAEIGVNLAAAAYYHQCGAPRKFPCEYPDDARLLFLKQDFRAFWNGYRKTGEWSLVSYAKSLMAKKMYRIYDRNDVLPFFASLAGFAVRIPIRAMRKLLRRRHSASALIVPLAANIAEYSP